MALHSIFPTVIASLTNYSADLLENEKLLNTSYTCKQEGYYISDDKYILNSTPKLKAWIEEQLEGYTSEVMAITQRLKITQSWCIKTEGQPQLLYPHRHPNSIISGSYYVAAPPGSEGLTFFANKSEPHPESPYIYWETNKDVTDKPWLFTKATFPVATNHMLLFQSHIKHAVEGVNNKNLRCVLAFNTWFADSIGDDDQLTKLDTPAIIMGGPDGIKYDRS